jgi:predicted outer membrane repeat protein
VGDGCTLREAIAAANAASSADSIVFAQGVQGTVNLTGALPELRGQIFLSGPGALLLTVRRFSGGDYRIFSVTQDAIVTMQGLTISHGRLSGTGADRNGAGIYNAATNLTLVNCQVVNNGATGSNNNGTLTAGNGGGIYNVGQLVMYSGLVAGNSAFGIGGGLCNEGDALLLGTAFHNNATSDFIAAPGYDRGGAIYSASPENQQLQLSNCTFTGNTSSDGGAIHSSGETEIVFSTFTRNQATGNGGAISNHGFGRFLLQNCTFNDNQARFGGALFNNLASFSLENCTLSGNAASAQGGAICTGDDVRLSNCTITRNTAPAGSGSGVLIDDYGADVMVQNSIISGNANSDVDYLIKSEYSENTFDSDGYNLIGTGNGLEAFHQSGDRINITEPNLRNLANNGGPTQTHLPTPGSPAIDAGYSELYTDQRGQTRPLDGNGDGSARTDIGAVEFDTLLSINDVRVKEYDSGVRQANFTVTLLAPCPETVRVRFSTFDAGANAPTDYQSAAGILTFAPRQTRQTVSVQVKGDQLDEADETLQVLLYVAENAVITKSSGVLAILDDDLPPTISISDTTISEGDSGYANATFRVSLSAPSGRAISVIATSYDGSARVVQDYLTPDKPFFSQPVFFDAGETSKTLSIPVKGDLLDEVNENFFVILSAPANASLGRGRGVGTIIDDDATPSLSIDNVSIDEGDAGTKSLAFTVALSKASGQGVSVNFATANGTALAGSDYTGQSGTLTFAPGGPLTQSVRITIVGDVTLENDETLYVFLSSASNAGISKARGVGTVTNDDVSG